MNEDRRNKQWLQYYRGQTLTLARCHDAIEDGLLKECDLKFRIAKTNPYLFLRCSVYYESLVGPNSRQDIIEVTPRILGSADNSIHVSEYILGDIAAQAVHDVLGTDSTPLVFPEAGLTGITFESRDMADGLEISLHLNGCAVTGRWAFAWKALSRERMSMEEWKEAILSVNCDAPTPFDLGQLGTP
jgi:hypothetical protein